MNSVFRLPKALPRDLDLREVPLYRVTKYTTLSPKIKEVVHDFNARADSYKGMFNLEGEAIDQGSSVVVRDESKVLEIYRPSDSFWWYDEDVANREAIPDGAKLPSDEDAVKKAQDYLSEIGLDLKYATVASVVRSSVGSTSITKRTPSDISTEVHVNFSFKIDDYPIMGPGAKIRVSMVEDSRISSVVYFWRVPQKKESPVKVINPEAALTWLTREPRYSHLTPDQIQITVDKIRLGYYAVPPFQFQRLLIPVYEIRGVEESRLLGTREVVIYTPAIDLSATRIKSMSFVDQMDISRVLASSK